MKRVFLTACLVIISACGGGGGGGGGSSSGSSAPTGARVLHGAIDVSPVDLYSSNQQGQVLQTARFAETTLYAPLSTGAQDLILTLHNSTGGVSRLAATIEKNSHSSFLLYGNETGLGINGSLISDETGDIPAGSTAIKIVHAVVGAAELNASIGVSAAFGRGSSYVFLPGGLRTVSIKRANDGRSVASVSQDFQAGKAYTIFVTGELDYFTASRVLED